MLVNNAGIFQIKAVGDTSLDEWHRMIAINQTGVFHGPMGRTASADEVAGTVLFLASDESSYCSGHEYLVDGAMTA